MKKIVIVFILFGFYSQAAPLDSGVVTNTVQRSFRSSFQDAKHVKWFEFDDLYKAEFMINNEYVFVFYEKEGGMIYRGRNLRSTELPVKLRVSFKESYPGFWVTDLFELSNENGSCYYLGLENAKTKLILQSRGNSWIEFKP